MTGEARVLLVDDHAVLRAGLRVLLEREAGMRVVGEAGDGEEAVVAARRTSPDIILLDLSMPKVGGLDALASLRQVSPRSRILVLTMHDTDSYVRRAIAMGASGYILKRAVATDLLTAVRAVLAGDVYLDPRVTRGALDPTRGDELDADLWSHLTDRERQVLGGVAHGHTNARIAESLYLSVKTVETYRARGLEKLEVRSRAGLVNYMLTHDLLHPEPGASG